MAAIKYKKLSVTPEAYRALVKFKVDHDIPTLSEAILRLIKISEGDANG